MTNANVCFFRSFRMAEPGSMLPRIHQRHKEPHAAHKTSDFPRILRHHQRDQADANAKER